MVHDRYVWNMRNTYGRIILYELKIISTVVFRFSSVDNIVILGLIKILLQFYHNDPLNRIKVLFDFEIIDTLTDQTLFKKPISDLFLKKNSETAPKNTIYKLCLTR